MCKDVWLVMKCTCTIDRNSSNLDYYTFSGARNDLGTSVANM